MTTTPANGYPHLNTPDFWADVYRRNGAVAPWTLNWRDGRVVPRGEGGTLDTQKKPRRDR
jgi:hypothetical protein